MSDYQAPEQDVVVYSRVRLARNFADTPFMSAMDDETAETNIRRVKECLAQATDIDRFEESRMRDLTKARRVSLVEKQLVSLDALKRPDWSLALVSRDETVTVMVNEDDHIRIQGKLAGLQMQRAGELALQTEEMISSRSEMAFDSQWGYLTGNPANAGTGMRAGVALHLPAILATGQIAQVAQAVGQLGMSFNPIYVEGRNALCAMYLMCNQATLGRSEDDVIRSLIAATMQVVDHEHTERANMSQGSAVMLADRLMRSVGTLKYARVMSFSEFMTRVSDLRMAAALSFIDMPFNDIDRLIAEVQPATLEAGAGGVTDQHALDILRQTIVARALSNC